MVKGQDKFAAAFANTLLTMFGGMTFMFAVGVVHHEWWPAVPTIGYWWSVLLVYLIRSSFGAVKPREMAQDREDKELRKLRRSMAATALAESMAEFIRNRRPS